MILNDVLFYTGIDENEAGESSYLQCPYIQQREPTCTYHEVMIGISHISEGISAGIRIKYKQENIEKGKRKGKRTIFAKGGRCRGISRECECFGSAAVPRGSSGAAREGFGISD